ncbi:MAG: heme A synthase [Alphaproteobacteria bacterium]|nr:heme A synthase [Alphaproteobacteria bacterium]
MSQQAEVAVTATQGKPAKEILQAQPAGQAADQEPAHQEPADVEPASPEPDAAAPPAVAPAEPLRPVRLWLWIVTALVFLMVIVGGATRLTESGLSITEWKPVTGAIPPLSAEAWQGEFEKYKKIPQYSKLFPEITLDQFKVIYFWEWGHRQLGRLIGIVFALPLLWFAIRGVVRGKLLAQLLGVLALGGLQGAVGWWMVASGLVGRIEVAPERLMVHLTLAALTFIALIWIAAGLKPAPAETVRADVRRESSWLVWLFLAQIALGALVAGSRAGLTYNSWPLMDGHLVPPSDALMKLTPWWLNFLENPTMIQFQHRMFAYLLIALVIGHLSKVVQLPDAPHAGRRAGVIAGLTLAQAGLGIATLLMVLHAGRLPIHVALAHQGVAFLILGMAVVHARRTRPALQEP